MCQGSSSPRSLVGAMAQPSINVESVYGRRIVFFGAAEDVSELTLLQLFSQHGDVTGLFVVRSVLGLPCGCGYVTMASAEQAAAAAKSLNGTSECAEPGGGKLGLLIIHTSSSKQGPGSAPSSPTEAAQGSSKLCSNNQQSPMSKDSRSVFFTKVPPTVTAHQLIQLFTSCGEVLHLELFTPWPGAKISKGCGLVEFASREAASAAVLSLHQAFTWPHSHSPLIVECVDSNRQSANRANKARSAGGAVSDQGGIRRALAAPMGGRKLAGTGALPGFVQGQPGSAMYAAAMQHHQQLAQLQHQHLGTHSCPLPMSWRSPATTTFVNSSVLPTIAVQGSDGSTGYRTPGSRSVDGSGFHQQSQQRDGAQLWWHMQLPPQRGSAVNSYEVSAVSAGLALSSNQVAAPMSSTGSNLAQLSPPGYSHSLEASLQACSGTGFASDLCNDVGNCAVSGPGMGASPTMRCSEPLAVAAAAAMDAGSMDAAWQQLQAQNIMLLQPMGNPMDEVAMGERVLLPASTAGLVEVSCGTGNPAGRPSPTAPYGVARSAGGSSPVCMQQRGQQQYPVCYQLPAPSPQVQQLLQQQQVQAQQRQLVAAAQQQQQAQHWWVQQQHQSQQQVGGAEEAAMVLMLSAQQLAAMPQVLQDVARMTGAKACLAGAADGSVQLMLTGRLLEVQTAHSVAGMLLAKIGVEEPLLPASSMRSR